jgi:hypothetical protein
MLCFTETECCAGCMRCAYRQGTLLFVGGQAQVLIANSVLQQSWAIFGGVMQSAPATATSSTAHDTSLLLSCVCGG